MSYRMNDAETEAFVLSRGLLTNEQLSPFRVQCSVDLCSLFELMIQQKIISPEMLAELEKNAPPPAAPRSIRSGTTFLRRPESSASMPAVSGASSGAGQSGMRRTTRLSFDDAPSPAAKSSQTRAAVIVSAQPAAAAGESHPKHPLPPESVPAPIRLDARRRRPHGWPGGAAPADSTSGHVQQWLASARQSGASDVYLCAGCAPLLRIHGELHPFGETPAMSAEQVSSMAQQLLTCEQFDFFQRHGSLRTAYAFAGGGRFRVALSRHNAGIDIAIRIVPEQILSAEQLGLPEGFSRLAQFQEGLILFAGVTNSGKTMSMLALLEMLNRTRNIHITTLEDPVEFVLTPAMAEISQRELGVHTGDDDVAVAHTLQCDSDVLMIGELHDYRMVQGALAAAETGQLVMATLPAADCAHAIDRLLDCPGEPLQLRNRIADSLRAIFSQQLAARADGQGRAAVCELLLNSISVANIIREAKTQNLVNVMQTGRQQGLIMMDDSLRALADAGVVSGEEAYARCKNKALFKKYIEPQEELEEIAKPPEPPQRLRVRAAEARRQQ
ncbi:MAG TPA: ATPase, T2SS/T4P/T4SS family [Planctomycetota bacterium]|nr:ATPase, T2SS/T4P/T4SS family [Planctomycetota bacterium]